MKIIFQTIFLGAVLLFPIGQIQAQDGKIEHEVSEEVMDTTLFKKLQKGYNYVVRADKEETKLFKIGLLGAALYPITNFENDTMRLSVIELAYEKKIKPELSWQVGLDITADDDEFREVIPTAGMRYYYNMNKRILKGKTANNFSANYLGLFGKYNHFIKPSEDSGLSINAVFGIQRRLGKYGFLDFQVGFGGVIIEHEYQEENHIELNLDFRMGLAF